MPFYPFLKYKNLLHAKIVIKIKPERTLSFELSPLLFSPDLLRGSRFRFGGRFSEALLLGTAARADFTILFQIKP